MNPGHLRSWRERWAEGVSAKPDEVVTLRFPERWRPDGAGTEPAAGMVVELENSRGEHLRVRFAEGISLAEVVTAFRGGGSCWR